MARGASNQRDSAQCADDAGAVFSDAGMLAESQSPASIWFKISAPPLVKKESTRGALEVARGAPARTSARARDAAELERASHPPRVSTRRRVDASSGHRRRARVARASLPNRLRRERASTEIPAWRREAPCSRRRRSLPRSRRARPRGVSSTCSPRTTRRARARTTRWTRRSRTPSSSVPLELGPTFSRTKRTKTVPASVSRPSASACGVCCSGTSCARWTRCIFCARWSAARPRSRARPACSRRARRILRICSFAWATRKSFSPSEKLPATKTRTTLPARLRLS